VSSWRPAFGGSRREWTYARAAKWRYGNPVGDAASNSEEEREMSDANAAIIADHIAGAPLARLLGVAVESVLPDVVVLRLPYRDAVTTMGDLVHGGAIGALIDTAATAAAWTGADLARGPRGTTIGLTINFLAGAHADDLRATARVIQRGRSIVVCDVSVAGAAHAVARALVTYKLDHANKA
jgi:uncharacterized protein (TIGR00369 family)